MKYVVIGASAAGINGIRAIRALDAQSEVVLISEDDAIYSRCILHHYISGDRDEPALNFSAPDFIAKHKVTWKRGVRVCSLDRTAKQLMLSDNTAERYDKLLIATGASTFFPPVKGLCNEDKTPAQGVYGLRTLADARTIKAAAPTARSIVILGAGLIAVDAASGLLALGKEGKKGKKLVALIEAQKNMLPIQLDSKAAEVYQRKFAEMGGAQYYGLMVKEIKRDATGILTGVELSDGSHVACDMLVCAAGVRANTAFLAGSGVELDQKGLTFNLKGETNDPCIYGAGDVSGKSPIWTLAVKQGLIAGTAMAGGSLDITDFFASKSAMSFWGVKTLSLGIHTPPDMTYTVETEERDGTYKKIIHKDGRIYGAIIQGDISYTGIITQLIAEKINVSRVKKPLFSIDYSDFFKLKDNFEFTYQGGLNGI